MKLLTSSSAPSCRDIVPAGTMRSARGDIPVARVWITPPPSSEITFTPPTAGDAT